MGIFDIVDLIRVCGPIMVLFTFGYVIYQAYVKDREDMRELIDNIKARGSIRVVIGGSIHQIKPSQPWGEPRPPARAVGSELYAENGDLLLPGYLRAGGHGAGIAWRDKMARRRTRASNDGPPPPTYLDFTDDVPMSLIQAGWIESVRQKATGQLQRPPDLPPGPNRTILKCGSDTPYAGSRGEITVGPDLQPVITPANWYRVQQLQMQAYNREVCAQHCESERMLEDLGFGR